MDQTDRLFELYCCYYERHASDSQPLNDALSSIGCGELCIRKLSRHEFAEMLRGPSRNPDIRRRWLNRIVFGHPEGRQLVEDVLKSAAESSTIQGPHYLASSRQQTKRG